MRFAYHSHMNTETIRYGAAAAAVAFSLFLVCGLAATPANAEQAVYLGAEIDSCGGVLHVKNRYDKWIKIERTKTTYTTVDVAIDGDGYWRWRCGDSNEKSRGKPNYRNRVKRVRVNHSTNGRDIVWTCYDLLK